MVRNHFDTRYFFSLRDDKSKKVKSNEVHTLESATINEISPTKSLREQLRESKEPVIGEYHLKILKLFQIVNIIEKSYLLIDN